MNVTASGNIAVGSPNSIARMKSEAEYADKQEDFSLLLMTDEGKEVLRKFALQWGCGEEADFNGVLGYFRIYRKDFEIWIKGFYA